jgi:uncharacterized membrane protein YagU involved in acid resistance
MKQLLQTILLGGVCAGVLDITAASINSTLQGGGPVRVFQSVAGGWLGRATFQGGWKTAALGLAIHFLIAASWTAIYATASLKLPLLTRQALLGGVLYGCLVYLFMYGIVLPLSAYHAKFSNQTAAVLLTGLLIHIFCVGLPIALVTRRLLPAG